MIDIVDIKQAIKKGEMSAYVKGDSIYLKNDIDETVEIGKIDKQEPAKWLNPCMHIMECSKCGYTLDDMNYAGKYCQGCGRPIEEYIPSTE